LQEFESLKESPAEGVYIYGLFLDGCAWSGRENKLVEPEPKKLYHPLPVLYVSGVLAKVSCLLCGLQVTLISCMLLNV
jgi:dynein heavy chain